MPVTPTIEVDDTLKERSSHGSFELPIETYTDNCEIFHSLYNHWHDEIEQFVAMFPRRGKALFKVVNHTIELALFLYLIPFAVLYLKSAFESGQVSPACQIPMYYIQAAPLVSFVLVAFRIIQRWIIEFKIVIRKDEEKEEK